MNSAINIFGKQMWSEYKDSSNLCLGKLNSKTIEIKDLTNFSEVFGKVCDRYNDYLNAEYIEYLNSDIYIEDILSKSDIPLRYHLESLKGKQPVKEVDDLLNSGSNLINLIIIFLNKR